MHTEISNIEDIVNHPIQPQNQSSNLLASLQARANALLAELTVFQELLSATGSGKGVEVSRFKNSVLTECKTLDKVGVKLQQESEQEIEQESQYQGDLLAEDGQEQDQYKEQKVSHVLRSSNLPFYEAVWSSARRCRGVKALGKRMYFTREKAKDRFVGATYRGGHVGDPNPSAKHNVLIDIVAEDGLEWIKVSAKTEKRLLFEMAKEGWEGYGHDSDSESCRSDHDGSSSGQKAAAGLELIRQAEDIVAAARQTRVRYHHPKVRFVLPKIVEGRLREVDAVIADLRATGVGVDCASSNDEISEKIQDLSLSHKYEAMLRATHPTLTPTLNIDCTILLALISDISHLPRLSLPPCPTKSQQYHSAILRQIDAEERTSLLTNDLYPVLASRDLVCASAAANRMREIVQTMGTVGERERARILFGEAAYHGASAEDLRGAMQSHSTRTTPSTLNLPIKVIDYNSQLDHQPPSTFIKAARLSPINTSVFLYGWVAGIVTVTSNRAVAYAIERTVNDMLDGDLAEVDEDSFEGPRVWVCDTARSLVGKDRDRKEG